MIRPKNERLHAALSGSDCATPCLALREACPCRNGVCGTILGRAARHGLEQRGKASSTDPSGRCLVAEVFERA